MVKGKRPATGRGRQQGERKKSKAPKRDGAAAERPRKATGGAKRVVKLSGKFIGHARGFGFVTPETEGMADVFIPARSVGEAVHGDVVEIGYHAHGRYGRAWGVVLRVAGPRREPVVGLYNGVTVVPRDARFTNWVRVAWADAGEAEAGDMVAVEITKRDFDGVHGRVVEVLGRSDDPGIESRIVLHSRGFDEEFPVDAVDEAKAAPAEVRPEDVAGRRDVRSLFTFTIDPVSARDFDDALAVERVGAGYRVWVFIADVSHYVRPGSAIDEEAYERATSVYLPDRAIHMLPTELSAGICSLKEGVDRLAMAVELEFDASGVRTGVSMYPAVIRSSHRCSYEGVEAMETDPKLRAERPGVWEAVIVLRELMERRRAWRVRRGSIDLDVPEQVVVLDEDGGVETVRRSEQTWSHKLVEEFMLAANEAVAEYLTEKKSPMVYRIHEPPAPADIEKLADMLAPLGFKFFGKDSTPEHVRPHDYQRVIAASKGTPYEAMVKILCLRSMMQARYSSELAGHFGLAAERYCHFTSPIRRYPDLIVHRLLKVFLDFGERDPRRAAPAPLAAAAAHASERERAAMEAEREMVSYYCALWMKDHLGEEFEGTVSGVTQWGIYVELTEVFIEGMVPAELIDEQTDFHADEIAIYAQPSNIKYMLGDKVRVVGLSADLEKRKITFELVKPEPEAKAPAPADKRGRPGRPRRKRR